MRGRQRPTPWSSSSCSWHLGRLSTAKHGRALLEKRVAALADVIALEGAPAQGRDLASFAIGEAALGGGVEQAEDPLHSLHRQRRVSSDLLGQRQGGRLGLVDGHHPI